MTRIEIDSWLKKVPMSELIMLLLVCSDLKCGVEPWTVIEQEDGIIAFQNQRWKQAASRQLVIHEQQLSVLNDKIFALLKDNGIVDLIHRNIHARVDSGEYNEKVSEAYWSAANAQDREQAVANG